MATVLVIDDQMELRTLFQRVLENQGHSVFCACNGDHALRSTESWTPDLILLDLAMPEMDGLAYLRIIRARPGWADVPVIMLSGLMSHEQTRAAEELGVCDQLLKGEFSTRELRARVAKYLKPHNALTGTAA
ncbi:MAG TPA: response regulator [Tepidisphaeraceae bacterium]|nr:response regulator [Tepidisphaeraceae bacterium]